MIRVNLTYTENPSDEFDVLNAEEQLADHVYYALDGIKSGGGQAEDGNIVVTIPDKVGNKPLAYHGRSDLALSTPNIRKITDKETYIRVLNLPDQIYYCEEFEPNIGYPRDFATIIRVVLGQSFEQFQDGFITGDGFGDNGTVTDDDIPIGFRARVANQDPVDDSFVPFYNKALVQICYESDRTRLWVNGVLQGEVAAPYEIPKQFNGLFVATNNVDHHWFASYHFFNSLSDGVRATFADSVMAKHGCDELPPFPYAYAIGQSLAGGVWSANFLTNNPTGGGVNLALTQYQWVINIRKTGDFYDQKIIATTPTITNTDLLSSLAAYKIEIGSTNPADFEFVYVKVKVFDNSGNGWEYLRGTEYTRVN